MLCTVERKYEIVLAYVLVARTTMQSKKCNELYSFDYLEWAKC